MSDEIEYPIKVDMTGFHKVDLAKEFETLKKEFEAKTGMPFDTPLFKDAEDAKRLGDEFFLRWYRAVANKYERK